MENPHTSSACPWGGDEVAGILRLVRATGLRSISIDAAAALSMATHMGMPIFMDGEFSQAEPEAVGHIHPLSDLEAEPESGLEITATASTPGRAPQRPSRKRFRNS